MTYGVISTYNETIFLRQVHDGTWVLEYSPVIHHSTKTAARPISNDRPFANAFGTLGSLHYQVHTGASTDGLRSAAIRDSAYLGSIAACQELTLRGQS